MAKYKVGDKVRIVGYRTFLMNSFGEMDKWLGKVMTVRGIERGSHGWWKIAAKIKDAAGCGLIT